MTSDLSRGRLTEEETDAMTQPSHTMLSQFDSTPLPIRRQSLADVQQSDFAEAAIPVLQASTTESTRSLNPG